MINVTGIIEPRDPIREAVVRGLRKMTDEPNQEHYTTFSIQPIDYMKSLMEPLEYEGFLRGNVIKYVSRYRVKNGVEDLKKARTYLNWLIDFLSIAPETVDHNNPPLGDFICPKCKTKILLRPHVGECPKCGWSFTLF